MSRTIRIGALVSGSGTNLQAIIDACQSGKISGTVVFVGSDNSAAPGLEKARKMGIPTFVVDYTSIVRRYQASSHNLRVPHDFNCNDIVSKQNLLVPDDGEEKIKAFFTTRAIAEAKVLDKMKPYPFDLLILAGFM